MRPGEDGEDEDAGEDGGELPRGGIMIHWSPGPAPLSRGRVFYTRAFFVMSNCVYVTGSPQRLRRSMM